MKQEQEPVPSPPKLVELDHPYAELIARGNLQYETLHEETERFCRTRPRPSTRRRAPTFTPVAVAAAVLIVLAGGVMLRKSGRSTPATAETPRRAPAALAPERALREPVVSEPGVTLAAGERKLSDGSVVNLSPGGSARLRDRGKATSLVLDGGKLTLAVERRAAGAELEVWAGAYRFKVIGTRFSVTRSGDAIGLRVDEGRVAVYGEKGELTTVSAGGDWSSADSTDAVPVNTTGTPVQQVRPPPADSPKPVPAAPSPDCRELARHGEPKRAEACYLERSAGTGLDAETALLEVARLRRDVLGDSRSALNALETYRRRFPNGSLRSEADLAHVVLLTRLGRHDEALTESQDLLDSPNGRERAVELHLLRGNVYRKSLGNVARAAQEYAKAEQLDGSNSEATYLLGKCLDELGDSGAATRAYRRYLDKAPAGKRAGEVRERLARLSP